MNSKIKENSDKSLEGILYVASGRSVVEIDPNTLEIIREYDFGHTIRSIFVNESGIYAGYKNGVFRKTNGEITDYRIIKEGIPEREFASNSIAVLNDNVFVSHSKFGIVGWPLDKPDKPKRIEKNPSHSLAVSNGELYYLSGFANKEGYPHFTDIHTKHGVVKSDESLKDMVIAPDGNLYSCGKGKVYELAAGSSRQQEIAEFNGDFFVIRYSNNLLVVGYDSAAVVVDPSKQGVINSHWVGNDGLAGIVPIDNLVFIATGRSGGGNYYIHKWPLDNSDCHKAIRLGHTIRDIYVK